MRAVLLAVLLVVGCGKADTPESRQAARRKSLEREADDWGRKGTVLQHEIPRYQQFVAEYRREFGNNWDDPPAKK